VRQPASRDVEDQQQRLEREEAVAGDDALVVFGQVQRPQRRFRLQRRLHALQQRLLALAGAALARFLRA
jgi:hypothetical protein